MGLLSSVFRGGCITEGFEHEATPEYALFMRVKAIG
jgi:hypothetical protein